MKNDLKGKAMNVHITSVGTKAISQRVRDFVMTRVEKATRRFTNRISRVDVAVANSDDALEQECRIVLSLNGHDNIAAHAQSDNLMAAIVEAVDRAKRGVDRTIGRTRQRRYQATAD